METGQCAVIPPEVVAAITVAVAEYLGVSPEQVRLRAVDRLAEAPLWALAGRLEQMERPHRPR